MYKWLPIESAPKDGTSILVYDVDEGKVKLVFWGSYRYFYPNARLQWGWLVPESEQDEQGGYAEALLPSHWMPLPEKPEGE